MDHIINESDIEIHFNPTRIDEANMKLDFQIYANNAKVAGQLLSKSYNDLEIISAHGAYDQTTDKMSINVPYSLALEHLMQYLDKLSGYRFKLAQTSIL